LKGFLARFSEQAREESFSLIIIYKERIAARLLFGFKNLLQFPKSPSIIGGKASGHPVLFFWQHPA
jgi:hypothetical protein